MPEQLLSKEEEQKKIANIKAEVKSYQDWPKPGIIFRDLFPVFLKPAVQQDLIDVLANHLKSKDVNMVIGIDSRGFLFAPILALTLNLPFAPVRKKGKLPGAVKQVTYSLEYGTDTLEIQETSIKPSMKVAICDDLLATGGTMKAAVSLVEQCGATVVTCAVVMELVDLGGRSKIPAPIYSVFQY